MKYKNSKNEIFQKTKINERYFLEKWQNDKTKIIELEWEINLSNPKFYFFCIWPILNEIYFLGKSFLLVQVFRSKVKYAATMLSKN